MKLTLRTRQWLVVPAAALALISLGNKTQALVHPFTQVPIEGAQETPPIDSDGSGVMDCVYNDSSRAITWHVDYELDTDSLTLNAAHFHGPAPAGAPAGVRLNLDQGTFPLGRVGLFRGTAQVSASHNSEVIDGLWYINLHSNVHGGGELRGQMIAGPVTHYFDSDPITGAQETPPITTAATGTIDAAYDAETNTLTFGARWANLSSAVTAMHFHTAPAGTPGGVVVNFANLGSFPTTTTGTFASSVVLSDALETQLLAGNFYINIHTSLHGGGEIRGQLNPIVVPAEVTDWLFVD